MNKPVEFALYKKVSKLSYNDFNRWITNMYTIAFKDGADAASLPENCEAVLSEDRLMEILLSVKGIGEKRANEILQKILAEGVENGLKDE